MGGLETLAAQPSTPVHGPQHVNFHSPDSPASKSACLLRIWFPIHSDISGSRPPEQGNVTYTCSKDWDDI